MNSFTDSRYAPLLFAIEGNSRSFEACSASIAPRATDLIGIYESDNGGKGE